MKFKPLTATQKSVVLAIGASIGVIATGVVSAMCSKVAEKKETKKQKLIAYAPAIGVGGATIGCVALSTKISTEEIAGLTVACAAISHKFSEYKKAVKENTTEEQYTSINEAFLRDEIDRLEAELAERDHPRDDDDWCTFRDSYTGYSFRAPLEQVEDGLAKAMDHYEKDEYLFWCDIFYLANNQDRTPYMSALGDKSPWSHGVGWSKGMFEQLYEGTDYQFDICLVPSDREPNTYTIEYACEPEPRFMEY